MIEIKKLEEPKTKYIHLLSDDDTEQITKTCFKDMDKPARKWIHENNILVVSKSRKECTLYDFQIWDSWNNHKVDGADNLFLDFMYRRFGHTYLEDYFSWEFNIEWLEEGIIKAQKKYQEAKDKGKEAIIKFEEERTLQ